jgi:hypothetical protein
MHILVYLIHIFQIYRVIAFLKSTQVKHFRLYQVKVVDVDCLPERIFSSNELLDEEFYLGCNAVWSVKSQPTFRRKVPLVWLIPLPWKWMQHAPARCRLTFNGLHVVISQKRGPFMITAMRIKSCKLLYVRKSKSHGRGRDEPPRPKW